jgi:hypothetical protein
VPTESQPTESPETNPLPDSEQSTTCSSLDDLLFSDFIRCSCDQEYWLLIRSGTPSPEQLVDAWVALVSEYHTLTHSHEAEKHATLAARIERLNLKINTVSALVEGMRMGVTTEMEVYHPFIEQLRNWGVFLSVHTRKPDRRSYPRN